MADPFERQLRRFQSLANRSVRRAAFSGASFVRRSIRDGSELTGAPGQPVRTSRLRNSWQIERLGPGVYLVFTDVPYAEYIEDGGNSTGPFDPSRGAPRSKVGGYHSVKLTKAAWPQIIRAVTIKKQDTGFTEGDVGIGDFELRRST